MSELGRICQISLYSHTILTISHGKYEFRLKKMNFDLNEVELLTLIEVVDHSFSSFLPM